MAATLQEKGTGIGGKFVKSFAPGSSEHLAIEKIDQLVLAFNKLLAKLDADAGVTDTNFVALLALAKTASDQLIPSPSKTST